MKFLNKYTLLVVPVIVILTGLMLVPVAPTVTEQPVSNSPEFLQYAAGKERKDAFFRYFLSLVENRNAEIVKLRDQLLRWHKARNDLSSAATHKVQQLAKEYRLNAFDTGNEFHWRSLLRRVDVVPPSLALAQAANESAWGTSRFALDARNYFGQWCFSKGCGLVPKLRGSDQVHEVAKFSSPAESVNSYIKNLNSHPAYAELRKIRELMRTAQIPPQGTELAKGLGHYSSRGSAYVEELQAMIRHNNLQQYDQI